MPILKVLGTLVSTLCLLVSMIAVGSPQITQLMPVLQSPLLSIHVAVVMLSYALFALIAQKAMMQNNRLRARLKKTTARWDCKVL